MEEKKSDKFGSEYKRQKYLETKTKKHNIDVQLLNHLNGIIELYEKRKQDNTNYDLVLKNLYTRCNEVKQLISTTKYMDELKDETLEFASANGIRTKLDNERKTIISEIENMCNTLVEKRKNIEQNSIVYLLLCEDNNIYVNSSNHSVDEILKEPSFCTLISPVEKILGHFKGLHDDAVLMTKYLIKKYPQFCTICGKTGKILDYVNDEKSEDELIKLLMNAFEKKEEKKTKTKKK